jgi:acyl carrier protein
VENEFNVEIPQSEITAEVFRSVSTLEDLILRLVPLA